MKSFHLRVICPKTPNLEGVKQAPQSERVKGYTAERYCLLRVVASEFPISGQLFSTTYGCGATERRSCLIFAFWPIFPIQNPYYVPSSDQPTAQGLHRRMILIFSCGSRRSKGVPSGTGVFLRLLLGELGTPKLAQISHTANGYTHTKCYYTARQIWTKDI